MKIWKFFLSTIFVTVLFESIASGAQTNLTLDLRPDAKNPSAPVMGNHLRFWSTITNTGTAPVDGLVAWISLVEIDPGNEQPVDLEDWSAHKAITGASLKPGQSLYTDWPMRLIKGGDYSVVISATDRSSHIVYTSATIQFHVRQKAVLQTQRVLPVAAGVPLLIVGLMIFNKTKIHRKKEHV